MLSRAVEAYPALVTSAVLDAYAMYLTSRGDSTMQRHLRSLREVPQSLEAALAPLEVLYGKTALSAIGIALHGAEPVIRYVEEEAHAAEGQRSTEEVTSDDEEGGVAVNQLSAPPAHESVVGDASHASASAALPQHAEYRARCLYHVGEHTLFSPFYCPCSAYAYQSIQRQEVWCCKHLLALQLALRVEATGLPQDTLRVRVVDAVEFEQLLLAAL